MRSVFLFLLIASVYLCPTIVEAQEVQKIREVAERFFQDLDVDTPGASVGVYRGATAVYEGTFGMADLAWSVPVTTDTVFLLASVSKQFTGWAVASLAAEGKLDLDADIREYIPEMHVFPQVITVRHLVHHTSGLRDEFDLLGMAGYRMDDVITHDTVLNLAFGQQTLNFEPGSQYLYSNTGYSLLAEIVRRVSGQTLASWLTENVFERLDMHDTHVHDDYRAWKPRMAAGYEPGDGSGVRRQIYSYENVGSTGVFSTVRDLGKWADALNRKTIGPSGAWSLAHSRGMLTSGDTLDYAFGQSLNMFRGHERVTHSGWHRGFRTVLMRFPEDDMSVIVLANTNAINPSEVAEEIMTTVFYPPDDSMAVYAGTYVSDELETVYRITSGDSVLRAEHARNTPFNLAWMGPDAFEADVWYFDDILFTRDEAGRVVGFEASTNRARRVWFQRR